MLIQSEGKRLDSNRGVMRGRKRKIVKENEQRKEERAKERRTSKGERAKERRTSE